jgi:hypothetical protein
MSSPHEIESVYHSWLHTVAGALAWELKFIETHCEGGLKIIEAALRSEASDGQPAPANVQPAQDFEKLEAAALERAQKGFAPPKEIYGLPYRDRIAWGKFPDWARPIDPEVFENSGHEG